MIFYLSLGFLCVKHSYFTANIILEILKYNFYECSLKNSDGKIIDKYVISKNNLETENSILLKSINNEIIRQNRELKKEINKLKIRNKEFEKNLILGNRIKEYRVADDNYIYENVKEKQMREGSGAIAEMYKIGGSAIAALIFGVFLARFFRKKPKHELAE